LKIIIIIVQVGSVNIYVAIVEALRKKEDKMKLTLPPKLVGKLVWGSGKRKTG
jgi:hypothetical protein